MFSLGRPSCIAAAFLLLFLQLSSADPLLTDVQRNDTSKTQPICESSLTVKIANAIAYDNGSAWDPVGRLLYPPGTNWREEGDGEGANHTYMGCPCKIAGRPCFRKCCPLGAAMNADGECISHDHPLNLNISTDGKDFSLVDGTEYFSILFGNPCLYGRYLLDPSEDPKDEFYIRSRDGFVVFPKYEGFERGPKEMCMDYFSEREKFLPLVCFPQDTDDK